MDTQKIRGSFLLPTPFLTYVKTYLRRKHSHVYEERWTGVKLANIHWLEFTNASNAHNFQAHLYLSKGYLGKSPAL